MSSGIKVNFNNFNQDIGKLKALSRDIGALGIRPPSIISTGSTPDEIEKTVLMYNTIRQSLKELVDNTVTFMSNTATSYTVMDKKAAANMDL